MLINQKKFQLLLQLIRLDKPAGTYLLFLPFAWGVIMPHPTYAQSFSAGDLFYLVFLAFIGAFLLRSSGCIINDYFDRNFDKHVERTKNRPLASGELNTIDALILLFILLVCGLWILVQLPFLVIKMGFFIIIPVIVYPLMKRMTWWPQLFLGFVFNFGIIMGWFAAQKPFHSIMILLYVIGIIWTFVYDTVYAIQDIDDDMRIGVKSSTIRLGNALKPTLIILVGIMSLLWFAILWFYNCWLGSLAFGIFGLLIHDIICIDSHNKEQCLAFFKKQTWLQAVFGIILSLLALF